MSQWAFFSGKDSPFPAQLVSCMQKSHTMLDTFLHHFLKNLDVLVFLQVPPSPPTSFCSVAGCCHRVIAGVWGAGLGGRGEGLRLGLGVGQRNWPGHGVEGRRTLYLASRSDGKFDIKMCWEHVLLW